jgi:hypothetical protein
MLRSVGTLYDSTDEIGTAVYTGRSNPSTAEGAIRENSRQQSHDNHCQLVGMAQRYGAIFVCLTILERWLELGIRPKITDDIISKIFSLSQNLTRPGNRQDESCMGSTWKERLHNLLQNPMDDLLGIKHLVHETRRFLWRAALPPCQDDHLIVAPSKIPMAEQGLFAACHLPAHAICCYYSGNVHSTQSSQSSCMLPNASYLIRIGTLSRKPWWHETLGLGIPKGYLDDENQAGLSADCLACGYLSLQEQWDQIMEDTYKTAEFYVDPSTNQNIKARFINDCLQEDSYNVKFVLDECTERAVVVTLRDIQEGEELYVSYGQAYWDSLEATTGIVPQTLMGASQTTGN